MNVRAAVSLIRPENWVKNLLVFAALIFSGEFLHPRPVLQSVLVFVGFSTLASAGYVLNDWLDRKRDRHHPDKSDRPIASGAISGPSAAVLGLLMLLVTLSSVWLISPDARGPLLGVYAAYAVLMLGYDFGLKHVFGLDLIIVTSGLVLRAVAGGVGIQVPLTSWFLLSTFFLCFMIIAGKRRHELVLIDEGSERHRPVLDDYDCRLLDALIVISGSTATVTYSLWVAQESGFPSTWSLPSILFVLFGLMRYLHLLYEGKGGSPETMFTRDWPMMICVLGWVLYIGLIMVLF